MSVVERFLKYVTYGTQSDPASGKCPSSEGQTEFARLLAEEMKIIGLEDVKVDTYGYVTGYLSSNIERETPAVGFIAHLDTSPEMNGEGVHPQLITNYAGNDIVLNKEKGIVLTTEEYPELMR